MQERYYLRQGLQLGLVLRFKGGVAIFICRELYHTSYSTMLHAWFFGRYYVHVLLVCPFLDRCCHSYNMNNKTSSRHRAAKPLPSCFSRFSTPTMLSTQRQESPIAHYL